MTDDDTHITMRLMQQFKQRDWMDEMIKVTNRLTKANEEGLSIINLDVRELITLQVGGKGLDGS